ncbi:hypothetical protein [Crocosphaera sp.]|uniref:hypothetical protein n=1 Tax=Crocosphaera sp. TaxID=2729996 RepID=UPI003F23A443|nr:hypothetical protein [Crocosphaera sp.]
MSDHPDNYVAILFHYFFYLILVGLLTFSLTYLLNHNEKDGVKSNLEKTSSFILKQAENAP